MEQPHLEDCVKFGLLYLKKDSAELRKSIEEGGKMTLPTAFPFPDQVKAAMYLAFGLLLRWKTGVNKGNFFNCLPAC